MSRHARKTANRFAIATARRGRLGPHSAVLSRLGVAGLLGMLTTCAARAPMRPSAAETQHVHEQITSAEAELQAAYVQLFPDATAPTASRPRPALTGEVTTIHTHSDDTVALSGASIPTPMRRHVAGPTCDVAAAPRCQDTCTLARAICNSANRICQLAANLSDDAWAQSKCERGAHACAQANTQCCGCK